jgi:hypothetical protein
MTGRTHPSIAAPINSQAADDALINAESGSGADNSNRHVRL